MPLIPPGVLAALGGELLLDLNPAKSCKSPLPSLFMHLQVKRTNALLCAGYFFTYYNTRITEERKAQIERVNEQVQAWSSLKASFPYGFRVQECGVLTTKQAEGAFTPWAAHTLQSCLKS